MSGSDEPQSCEYHVRASDGEDRFITWRGVALRDANNVTTGVMLSGEDITDQRRAENEAHRALERMNNVSRLATMGEMAAGISHELNQPLAAIANYAQACARLLRMPAPDMPEISGALEQISGQALRAGEIIRRIRSLVRNEDVRRETQDINELIREVHTLLASDARVHDGRLELDLAPALPHVTVDGVQIQQVLMNLVHNAFEAQGGEAVRDEANGSDIRSAHRHASHRRRRRRSVGQRSRSRSRRRSRAADLRALLHDQADRHRSRPGDQSFHHQGARRAAGLSRQPAARRLFLLRASGAYGEPAMKDLPQTVFVVDDDDAVRDSLRLLLKSAGIPCEVYALARRSSCRATTRRSPDAWCSTCACRA